MVVRLNEKKEIQNSEEYFKLYDRNVNNRKVVIIIYRDLKDKLLI